MTDKLQNCFDNGRWLGFNGIVTMADVMHSKILITIQCQIISTKEDMFYLAFACLHVCLLAG